MKILHRLRGEMETPRLLLRRWKPLDFQAFLRFAGDPEVMLPAGSRPAQGLQEAETQFHRALRDEGCYAMVLKGTGEPIGKRDIHAAEAAQRKLHEHFRRRVRCRV